MARSAKKSMITIIGATPVIKDAGAVATVPGGTGVELHSLPLPRWVRAKSEVDFGKFVERWHVVREQVGTMIADLTKQNFGKMALDEVEVSIGVSGEGSIGIATAKGEASIVLKFKKV